ncbi:hypothetical protein NC652_008769 [Populus alba x Populus x berolinensis]|nr:hypothetical protein NC652_008769 [Populus alba x Populus x berolinensis]
MYFLLIASIVLMFIQGVDCLYSNTFILYRFSDATSETVVINTFPFNDLKLAIFTFLSTFIAELIRAHFSLYIVFSTFLFFFLYSAFP